MSDVLSDAIQFAEETDPLPRCQHGSCLRDGAGELLEPPCGCRFTAQVAAEEIWPYVKWADNGKDAEIAEIARIIAKHTMTADLPSGWLPIASAPKDGTRILVYVPESENVLSVYWDIQFEYHFDEERATAEAGYSGHHLGAWTDDAVLSYGMEERCAYQPTHWMPLPAPPSATQSSVGDDQDKNLSNENQPPANGRLETVKTEIVAEAEQATNLREILERARGLVADQDYSVRDAIYSSAVNGESDAAAVKAMQDAGGLIYAVDTKENVLAVFDKAIAELDAGESRSPNCGGRRGNERNGI